MRKHRESIILGLLLAVVATTVVLDTKPATSRGRVLSAEPRPWYGAVPREQSQGLTVFGIATGDSVEALHSRVPPGWLRNVGSGGDLFFLKGPHVDVYIYANRDRIVSLGVSDLGPLYLDGRPLSKAGATRIGKELDGHPNLALTAIGGDDKFFYSDLRSQALSVIKRTNEPNVDFIRLTSH